MALAGEAPVLPFSLETESATALSQRLASGTLTT